MGALMAYVVQIVALDYPRPAPRPREIWLAERIPPKGVQHPMSLGKTRRTAALTLAISALALLGIVQPASAATVGVDQPCYIEDDGEGFELDPFTIGISASGLPPGELVKLELVGAGPTWGTYSLQTVGSDGNVSYPWTNKIVETFGDDPVIEMHPLKVTSLSGKTTFAETQVWMARYGIKVTDMHTKGEKFKFVFAGMAPEQTIYAHYVARGKEVFTHEMGVANAPCGGLETTGRLYPAKHSRFNSYRIQFDQVKKYSKKTKNGFDMNIDTGKF